MLAAWATLRRRPVLVGFFLALACLIKPQPLFLVPLFLVWLARQQSVVALRKALMVFVGVSFLGWLPYLLPLSRQPEVFVFLQNMQSFSAWQGAHNATSNAYNFWWLFGPHITAIHPLVGPFSASVIGWMLYALAMLLALRGIWQDESDRQFWLSLTLLAVAFFVVTVGQHERYLYPALAFAFLAVSTQRRLFWIAAGLAVSFTMNILLGILTGSPGSSALLVPALVAWIKSHPAFHDVLAGATACLNLVLLLSLAAIQIQRIRLRRLETAMSAQSPGELLRAGRTSGLH